MSRNESNKIYSATYSNVPVYELVVAGNQVMRRRSDDWINATHILKVADYDKPARTRILEREVQKGVHEKVQGGYGKYQGTWIPLVDGRELAAKNNVLDKLRLIFDFVPGDRSPPPAPKHATASSKPRQPRAPAKRQAVYPPPHAQDYDALDTSTQDVDGPDDGLTVASGSPYDDYDESQYLGARKRRRIEDQMSQADKEHQLWAEELLDYFVLQDEPEDSRADAPPPPANVDVNRPIDDKGYTALHWASAMGDLELVKDLVRRGASIDVQARSGETPLMRAVYFTNNYDKKSMDRLAGLLMRTVNMQEWSGSTVFHYIANSTERKSRYQIARYYMDCILNKMGEVISQDAIMRILDTVDQNGDTAITIAARNGARKCVRSLIGRGASVDIPNVHGETADQLIVQLNHRRQERHNSNRQLSSSPFGGEQATGSMAAGGPVQSVNGVNGSFSMDPLSQSSLNGNTQADGATEVYKSESALALTSSIMPVLFHKAKQLAISIDAEVAEKEAELAEAERLAAMRRHEIEILRRQAEEIRAKEEEQVAGAEGDDELIAELSELMEECEGLTQEEQDAALRELIEQEEQAQRDSPPADLMVDDEDESDTYKLALVRELHELLEKRKNLFKTIVQNLSVAGLGDKQGEYKRLITGALGVREEDVEGMLPDIVSELEDWQLENVNVA
ncbi:Cell division cycle-related res2 pct1 [Lecanosticta acicola]|uniref:Cell division cycle-related res2 pct1 n=1 Tax=Lecanosticta acicola TaxID=111012 RepID=A0AAI9EDM2_9PEZI|nr:Cell division cycle-related res2 pct1 [Lecanosticta acicola]